MIGLLRWAGNPESTYFLGRGFLLGVRSQPKAVDRVTRGENVSRLEFGLLGRLTTTGGDNGLPNEPTYLGTTVRAKVLQK